MSTRRYPQEVIDFVAQNVKGTPVRELAELTNKAMGTDFTYSKMKAFMGNHGLRNGLKPGPPTGSFTKRYPREVRDYIFANYKGVGPKEMAERLNETFRTNYTHSQIKGFYGRNKLDSGLTGNFEKGYVPWNKGKTGYMGANRTSFKKGNRPPNWVPIGTERTSKDGYAEVKIQDGQGHKNWRAKHILIWEEVNGPLPDGHALVFADKDKNNLDLDNLILVSRAQLARLNQNNLIKEDAELTKTGILIAELQNKAGERKRSG